MDHDEAVRVNAVEQYLTETLTTTARSEFEDHFFACQLCAADLLVSEAFLAAVKRTLSK